MPFHWYTDVLKRYAVFDGRAGRPEFWWFTLFSFIVAVAIGLVVEIAVGGGAGQAALYLYLLAVALPSLGVSIRRLHDTNRSGWWVLIGFVPLIGGIWQLVLMVLTGDAFRNRYGDPPNSPEGPAPRFDPQTGAPLQSPAPRFDPQTGQPLAPPSEDPPG